MTDEQGQLSTRARVQKIVDEWFDTQHAEDREWLVSRLSVSTTSDSAAIAAIRELLDRIVPWPWFWTKARTQQHLQNSRGSFAQISMPLPVDRPGEESRDDYRATAEFIATAPEIVRTLLAIIDSRPHRDPTVEEVSEFLGFNQSRPTGEAGAGEGIVKVLRRGTPLCRSGRTTRVEIRFRELKDAQRVHNWLTKLRNDSELNRGATGQFCGVCGHHTPDGRSCALRSSSLCEHECIFTRADSRHGGDEK